MAERDEAAKIAAKLATAEKWLREIHALVARDGAHGAGANGYCALDGVLSLKQSLHEANEEIARLRSENEQLTAEMRKARVWRPDEVERWDELVRLRAALERISVYVGGTGPECREIARAALDGRET